MPTHFNEALADLLETASALPDTSAEMIGAEVLRRCTLELQRLRADSRASNPASEPEEAPAEVPSTADPPEPKEGPLEGGVDDRGKRDRRT